MGVSGKKEDRHDFYFKKARAEQYRARSVYKLKEIQDKFKLFRRGMSVVDLGAAPGSWTQYLAEVVGTEGRVVAIDRTPLAAGLPSQVKALTRDMLEVNLQTLQEEVGVSRVQAVVSDMAPNTSGIKGVDHLRSVELCEKALEVAQALLDPGGCFVCKVFQGPELPGFTQRLRAHFQAVKTVKPDASRDESVEIFLVGTGFKRAEAGSEAGGEAASEGAQISR